MRYISAARPRLQAECAQYSSLWRSLGLAEAQQGADLLLPAALTAPPEKWHAGAAPVPLAILADAEVRLGQQQAVLSCTLNGLPLHMEVDDADDN